MRAVSAETRDGLIAEWRPDRRVAIRWNAIGFLLTLAGLVGFGALAVSSRGGTMTGGAPELAAMAVLTIVLLVLHEGVHGVVARLFGARPTFGVMAMAGMPALYTTAPGHRFSRREYVIVAIAPTALISGIGAVGCLTPAGPILCLPLAIHLGGCVGDLSAVREVLRYRDTVECEDLRDGFRIWEGGSAMR